MGLNLQQQYQTAARDCVECGLCQKDCFFLQQYGSPKEIAERGLRADELLRESFECSLCGLCTVVCPKDIDPALMLRDMRIRGREAGLGEFAEHRGILSYERWGISPLFTWYGLPQKCTAVFFPGCAMLGSRSRRMVQIYERLRENISGLGLVLDCCAKPSHDLGRRDFFARNFGAVKEFLAGNGVRTVLVACPSCYRVWQDYGEGMRVRTIYEEFARGGLPEKLQSPVTVTVHDPCAVRGETGIHRAVRELVAGMGLEISEMKHYGRRTVCCGEGGAACYLVPEVAGNWTKLRAQEAEDRHIITYCAGCTNFLGQLTRTDHVADLLFEPEQTLAGNIRATRSPLTWLRRLVLKKNLHRLVKPDLAGRRDRSGRVKISL
ncbi:MAG: (Fe-S)-binding protein [Desulfobulbaceae bacterium]|nr:(Fe-S)-binding protein [Desulfobulbaceae bacterium]